MGRKDRIGVLQRRIAERGFAGALLFYSRDILYYTGTAQPSYLAVLPGDFRLFVRSGFEFAANDVFIDKGKMKEERRLENICRDYFQGLPAGAKVATELDVLTAEQWGQFRKAFPGCEFVSATPLVLEQRKTKEPGEIACMRKACLAVHRGHEAVLANLREGMTELELAAIVENAHRLAGHEGVFFIRQPDFFMSRGPISSGSNLFKISGVVYTITGVGLSASVPAGPSLRKIAKGDLIMIDIPTHVEGYHADQTRTYCLGKTDPRVHALYDDLKAIADHLIREMKAGMKCSEIYRLALEKAKALGREGQFQNFGSGKPGRLIGHGIGIELNEPPIPSEYDQSEIADGYVIALDIHMMDAELGVVKLEDMILIRKGGNEILTQSPRDLFEV